MLKLAHAISSWKPAEVSAREPIVLLEACWSEIVGEQVAQNSHPARITGDALSIVTRSSAWSNQLSLLSEHVVRAVNARLPGARVERLRFRVGALPRRASAAPARTRRPQPRDVGPHAPASSAAEALGRFREEVERNGRAKRSAGWQPCAACGVLVAPGAGECAACVAAGARDRSEAAARLLFEAPWLGYAGTAALVSGLKRGEYERIRSQLLSRWWGLLVQARDAKRLSRGGRERLVASSYVLLRSGIPPEEILPATVRSVLGDELHDLIYREQ